MKNIFPLQQAILVFVFLTGSNLLFSEDKNTYNIFTVRQETINEIAGRFDNNSLTEYDLITLEKIYKDIIFFGGFVYPEASKILGHYIFGNGEDLIIVSKYFYRSRIITDALNSNPNAETIGPITLRINEDPRIAYAVNGFYIKNSDVTEIYQEINFAGRNDRHTYTPFRIINREIIIPDRLVRAFERNGGCKTFTVRIRNR